MTAEPGSIETPTLVAYGSHDGARAGEGGASAASLSLVAASPRERRVAFAVLALSLAIFAATVPLARVPVERFTAFVPAYQAAITINDLVTATLLFGQFAASRARALLVLGGGYVYTAIFAFIHQLTFPGAYSPAGLLGAGPQTTAWLYMFWHGGFPLFVAAYAFLTREAPATSVRMVQAIVGIVAAVFAFAGGITALATAESAWLPALIVNNTYTSTMIWVVGTVWGLSVLALAILWRRRPHSVIDLWLMTVLCAWIFDIGLGAVFNSGRFDVGFYAGRIYGLLASAFVMIVLLVDTTRLHEAMAASAQQLADLAGTLQERVRERTAQLERTNESLKSEIAERQKTTKQLVQAQKMEAIGTLTGGIAHDFNNLLGVVMGNLGLILDVHREDAEVTELAGDAIAAATSGAELTRQLLAFSRRQPLQPRRIVVNDLVSEITKLLRRTLGDNIEVSLDLGADAWMVVADPAQLQSSLANLATNARDAMPKGGRLTIVTAARYLDADYAEQHEEVSVGDYTMIEISDTGQGIPSKDLGRIFEPFYTTKEIGRGTGLGLAMVFGFVKQSGGHINVYSEEGVGTTFRIYLPRALETGELRTPQSPIEIRRARGETVLAIEDQPAMRKLVVRLLRELGYRVLEAENGAAALEILERERVSLIFSDVVMPGGTTGLDIARIAAQRWPLVRIVLTSGFPQAHFSDEVAFLGNLRMLSKPYRKEELARALREALDGASGDAEPALTG